MGCGSAEGIKYVGVFVLVARKTQVANFYLMNPAIAELWPRPSVPLLCGPAPCPGMLLGRERPLWSLWEKLESQVMECAVLLTVLLIFKMWI